MNELAKATLTATQPSDTPMGLNLHPQPLVPEHRLLRCIGQGAYGEVWLAQNAMGSCRAVKVVYRDSFRDEQPYEREFKGIQRFEPISRSHDGFVDILQIGRNDPLGYFYYVMELADDANAAPDEQNSGLYLGQPLGGTRSREDDGAASRAARYSPKTLRSVLQDRGRLPVDECLQLALSLNLTLGHLHRQGLIHRDIKPSNIVFVRGIPKLADVGLVTDVSEARTFVGTEGFIPPEGPNSIEADIYSLGKVLYEISMGKDRKQFPEPFTGLGDMEGSIALAELNAVIARACATDPGQRYQSAEEMHLDLALLHGGKSVRKKRAMERRLAFLTRLSAVGIAVIACIVAALLYQQHQTQKTNRLAAELQLAQGIHVMDEGDLSGSLLWLVRAMGQARWTAAELEMHRLRFGAVASHCPKLVQVIPQERGSGSVDFSPDGQRVLTWRFGRTVQIFDMASGSALTVLHHSNLVWHASFSPDGARVLTASGTEPSLDQAQAGEARVWDANTGRPLSPPLHHAGRVFRAVFTPDARTVATASEDRTAQLWDPASGAKLGPALRHGAPVARLGFAVGGRRLVTLSEDGIAQVWDTQSGQRVTPESWSEEALLDLKLSHDGQRVLAVSQRAVFVWDVETGEQIMPPLEHNRSFSSVQFSPDDRKILAIGPDGSAQVWDAASGELFSPPDQRTDWVTGAEFSRDGRLVAVGAGDNAVQVWDAETGALVTSPLAHQGWPWGLRFHPDGRRLATTSSAELLVRIWEIDPRALAKAEFVHNDVIVWAGFSRDGSRVLTAGRDRTARVWDASTGRPVIPALPHHQFQRDGQPSLSQDGTRVLTITADTVQLRDAATGVALAETLPHSESVLHAELSSDAQRVVTAAGGKIQVWRASTGELLGPALPECRGAAFATFSPDGRRLATIGHAMTREFEARIWDLSTGQAVCPPMHGELSPSYSIAFSPDGRRVLTRSHNAEARVWDAATGQAVTPVLTHNNSPIYTACFSPDGRRVLTAGGNHSALLWDAATGKPLTRPLKHSRDVRFAAFSPDGRRVITASDDKTARIWDASTGLPLTPPLRHRGRVRHAEFSPDGGRAITASDDGTARLWEIAPIRWPVDDLQLLAQGLSGRTIDGTGSFTPLPATVLQQVVDELRAKHPEFFSGAEKR